MNRLIVGLLAAATTMAAQAGVFKVQGVPYDGRDLRVGGENEDPVQADPDFQLSDIKFWAGEGSNECAIVIQWSLPTEENAMVFGYRWDGDATGEDALTAVVKGHPQLYGAIDPDGSFGATLNGLGWDPTNDGNFSVTTQNGAVIKPDADGMFTASAAALDGSTPTNSDDYFRGGWFEGYWSYYWGSIGDAALDYSQVGMTGRQLEDGCVDVWIFAPGMQPQALKPWLAAEMPYNPGFETQFKVDGIYYNMTSDTTAEVVAPYDTDGTPYREFEYKIPATVRNGNREVTVTSIGAKAFYKASTMYLTLPATIDKIGADAFYCALKWVNMLGSVPPECGAKAFLFDGEDLILYVPENAVEAYKSVTPWSNMIINPVEYFYYDHAYYHITDADAHTVEVATVQNLPDASDIWYTGDVVIPEKAYYKGVEYDVTGIGEGVFDSLSSATSVTVPATVEKIAKRAVTNSVMAKMIMLGSVPPVCDAEAFGPYVKPVIEVVVPADALEAYKTADVWKDLNIVTETLVAVDDIFEINGVKYLVTSMGESNEVAVSYNAETIADEYWRNKVYYIGDYEIPASVNIAGIDFAVTSVRDHAFYLANQLGKVTLPETIRSIGKEAFRQTSVTEVNVPEAVETIEEDVFYACSSLTSLKGMKGVKTILAGAFLDCTSLTYIESLENVEKIDNYGFIGCSAMEVFPEMPKVKTIGLDAFSACHSLKYFVIPASIEEGGISSLLGGSNTGDPIIYCCQSAPTALKYVDCFRLTPITNEDGTKTERYADVYVPYGTSAAFKAHYRWNSSEILELSPVASTDEYTETIDGTNAEFRHSFILEDDVVEEDIPVTFLAANDFSGHIPNVARNMTLQYRKAAGVGTAAKAEAEVISIPAVEEDGQAVVRLENALAGDYEYRWVSGLSSQNTDTDWRGFTLAANEEGDPNAIEATFDFTDISTIKPAPTDDDWTVLSETVKRWYAAGVGFNNNGVYFTYQDTPNVQPGYVDNTSGATQLRLYGGFSISAPAGRSIEQITITGPNSGLAYYLNNVKLAEGQPGKIVYNVTFKDGSVTWVAPENEKVSTVNFISADTSRTIYINRIDVTLDTPSQNTGIDTIEADSQIEYYTIDGIRVANPVKGIYIERRGNKSRKVVL